MDRRNLIRSSFRFHLFLLDACRSLLVLSFRVKEYTSKHFPLFSEEGTSSMFPSGHKFNCVDRPALSAGGLQSGGNCSSLKQLTWISSGQTRVQFASKELPSTSISAYWIRRQDPTYVPRRECASATSQTWLSVRVCVPFGNKHHQPNQRDVFLNVDTWCCRLNWTSATCCV